jgi:ribose-phosphate pyrophosphokinase
MAEFLLFSGNANRPLAEAIARELGTALGRAIVSAFQDGETKVRMEENVRGQDVFVIQPTCPPVNHHLVELLIMIDALKRASAQRVTAVIPYYGYAKQEKKMVGREPVSAKLVANLLTVAGADRMLTIDMHAPAIEGFFDIPVDHLRAAPILADRFRSMNLPDLVVVSPDAGGVARAYEFRCYLGGELDLAIAFKHRPEPEAAEVLEVVGDVDSKTALIFDDMIQSGGTLVQASKALLDRGANAIYVAATHPVFAPGAAERLRDAVIAKIVVTDTIPLPPTCYSEQIEVLSIAPLLAEAIRRIHENRSLSVLFPLG